MLFEDLIEPGATWSHVLKRGTALRITDPTGGANVGALFYNAEQPTERYNMPDTLKAQHVSRLTRGNVLYSDMGRILCSITEDSVGWHDPLSGCGNAALVRARYGEARYQEHGNEWHQNAYDGFVIELEKWGLSARDMAAPLNFFSKVVVDDGGAMRFVSGRAQLDDGTRSIRTRAMPRGRCSCGCVASHRRRRTTSAACRAPRTAAASS